MTRISGCPESFFEGITEYNLQIFKNVRPGSPFDDPVLYRINVIFFCPKQVISYGHSKIGKINTIFTTPA